MHFATKAALDAYIKANQNLEYLVIDGLDQLPDLEELTELPPGLVNLFITNCPNLKRLRTAHVAEVWIGNCPNFVDFQGDEKLATLNLYRLALMDEPATLPDSIEHLRIELCPSITALRTLPTSLRDLTLINNRSLSYVAPRSGSLFIVIDGCPELLG